ncbi:MAG: DUF2868 domain-containing protein [Phycisphaeraceae bacterium]
MTDVDGHGETSSTRGRVLAEAVRAYEAAAPGGAGVDDRAAEAAGRAVGGDFERRLVARAAALPAAGKLSQALDRVTRAGKWAVVVGVVLMAVAGAGAARGAMAVSVDGGASGGGGISGGGGQTVNVFWALGALLGVQTLLLLGWLVAMVGWPGGAGQGSLGAAVLGAGRWLASRVDRSAEQLAAMEAVTGTLMRSGAGRWVFGLVSHALWAGFNVGCLVMLLVLLSVRHYTFAWETTILSPEAYVQLTQWLAALPGVLGLPAPTVEQVVATQAVAEAEALNEARWAWAGLLAGSLVCYGLAPRALLAVGCALAAWRAQRRWRLDVTLPGYGRLRERLMPTTRALGVVEGADVEGETEEALSQERRGEGRPVGPAAIVAVEVRSHEGVWPPVVDDVQWRDLGFVDDREGRRRVIEALEASEVEPAVLVVVCELAATPDRGTERYLGELRRTVTRSPLLLLTGGQALRERGDTEAIGRRLSQWRTLAERVGIDGDAVLDLDLDHATDASLRQLAQRLPRDQDTTTPPAAGHTRHLEAAFDRIVTHARQWQGPPDPPARSKLHREIAALYRSDGGGDAKALTKLLDVPTDFRGDWQSKVRNSASRVVDMLPPSLRLRPRWLAAGAASGALGCVAAATLLSPLAIAALPTWTAIGAAIAAAAQPRGGHTVSDVPQDADEALHSDDYTEAVDAAALFAMLLQLQGLGEATISRVLDRVLTDVDDTRRLTDADAVRRWLDELRHRFDVAFAEEVRA